MKLPMLKDEARLLQQRTGRPPTYNAQTQRCSYLVEGRCSVYSDRPLVCRLYGAVPDMRCEYGCETELMTEAQVRTVIRLRAEQFDAAELYVAPPT